MSEEKKRRKRKLDLEEVAAAAQPEAAPPEEPAGDGEEGFVVKRAPWILRVDGLELEIPLTGLKLPTFTTGMIDQGSITIETINIPEIALNSYFRSWLMKPIPRGLKIRMLHPDGKDVETWTMSATPAAMGFSELDVQDDAPWVTQVAFSVTGIKIEPVTASV